MGMKYKHCPECPCKTCNPADDAGSCGGIKEQICYDCEWDTPEKLPDNRCFEEECFEEE